MTNVKHQNPGKGSEFTRCTFAIDLFYKTYLITLVEQGIAVVPVKLGVSYVHPKDQYEKKIGASKATANMLYRDALLSRVEIREKGRVVFHFKTFVEDFRPNRHSVAIVEFGVSYVPDSNITRLEYIVME